MTRETIATKLYQTLLELGWTPPGQLRAPPVQMVIDGHIDGYWSQHPLKEDWLVEVINGETREGFWEWLYARDDVEEE